jgi:hypothetical protein
VEHYERWPEEQGHWLRPQAAERDQEPMSHPGSSHVTKSERLHAPQAPDSAKCKRRDDQVLKKLFF